MGRKVHSEGMRERQNMRAEASHRKKKQGEWCVVEYCELWDEGFGLGGVNYTNKMIAEERAEDLRNDEDNDHVDEVEVMKHDEYRKLCTGTSKEPPARMR